MLDDSKRPVPLGEESTVMTIDKGAEITLSIPVSGGTAKKLNESGRIWLTEQRVPSHFVATAVCADPIRVAHLCYFLRFRRPDFRVSVDPSGVLALHVVHPANILC